MKRLQKNGGKRLRGVKEIIFNNYFLHVTVLSVYNYGLWYLNKLTNYAIEKRRFKRSLGYSLNLKNPRSFNEKVVYKKIYDRNPLLTKTADKYKVREYVKKVLGEKEGEKILIPLLHVTNKPEKIPFEKLPKDFVVKANHGSGWNVIVRDNKYNKKELVKKCRAWIRTPFGLEKMEWAYKNINRKIIIEKFLKDEKGKVPKDYKFFVFHGKCKMVQVIEDRGKSQKNTFFNEKWKFLNVKRIGEETNKNTKKPKNFEKMKKTAEKLGKDFDFVRVDFYEIKDKIYLGEITHCPGSGSEEFKPRTQDFHLGKHWKIK